MKIEKKYLSYMNSTISHEMRNPLNSIMSQIGVFDSLVGEIGELVSQITNKLSAIEI